MGDGFGKFFLMFGGIVTLAMVAVLVSQKAQTSNIIQALGSAVGTSIGAAVSPLTANNSNGG
jgi:hypothetical protein